MRNYFLLFFERDDCAMCVSCARFVLLLYRASLTDNNNKNKITHNNE